MAQSVSIIKRLRQEIAENDKPENQINYQQFFKDNCWNLGNARRVHASPSLSLVQIALDEPHGAIKDLAKRTSIIFGVQILGRVDVDAGVSDGFKDELRLEAFRLFGKEQETGKIEHARFGGEIQVAQ